MDRQHDGVKYPYSRKFQRKILSFIYQHPELILSFVSMIKGEYFAPGLDIIADGMVRFTTKYKRVPSDDELVAFIGPADCTLQTKKTIKRIISIKSKMTMEFLTDQLREFAKYHAVREAIIKGAAILQDGDDPKQIVDLISKSIRTGESLTNVGVDLAKDWKTRIIAREMAEGSPTAVSTGLKGLDRSMNGGLDIGELGVVLGIPKGFKTGTLVNLGVAALNQGKIVVHYTLEISEDKTALRYERRVSGLTRKDLSIHWRKLRKSLGIVRKLGGKLIIKGYPIKSASVVDIQAHIDLLKSKGIIPDVIIVDYGDLVKPAPGFREKRDQLSQIYIDLRAMAQSNRARVWTASQSNRKGIGREIIGIEHIAEDIGKVAIADVVIALCQTEEERQLSEPRARIFIAANREGEEGGIIYTTIDYDRMRIREVDV